MQIPVVVRHQKKD